MPHPRRVLWLGDADALPEASPAIRDRLALYGWFVHVAHPPLPARDAAAFALVHCWGLGSVAAWLPPLLAMRDAGGAAILTPHLREATTDAAPPPPDFPAAPHVGGRAAAHRLVRLQQGHALTQVSHLLATDEEMRTLRRVFGAGNHPPVTFLPPADGTDAAVGATAEAMASVYDDCATGVPVAPAVGAGGATGAYIATLEDELGREYAARTTPDRDTEALEAEVAWYRNLVEGGEIWREWRRAEGEAADRLAHIMRLNAALTTVREEISRDHAVACYMNGQHGLWIAALIEAREERDWYAAQADALEGKRDRYAAQVIALKEERACYVAQVAALEGERDRYAAQVIALEGERDQMRSPSPVAPPTMRERVARVVGTRRSPKAGATGANATGTDECVS